METAILQKTTELLIDYKYAVTAIVVCKSLPYLLDALADICTLFSDFHNFIGKVVKK